MARDASADVSRAFHAALPMVCGLRSDRGRALLRNTLSSMSQTLASVKTVKYNSFAMPHSRSRSGPARSGQPAAPSRARSASVPDAALRRVQNVVDRLVSEFSDVLAKRELADQGPRALARALSADAVLCHRILSGIRSRGSLSERIAAWPGEAGVRSFAERLAGLGIGRAAGAASGAAGAASGLDRAVDEYARLIQWAGGSQTRLVRRVRSMQAPTLDGAGAPPQGPGGRAALRTLTRAAGEVLGYEVELLTYISLVRPIPGQSELLEGASAYGLIGLSAQGGRICVTSRNVQMRSVASAIAGETRWHPLGRSLDGRDGLLTEFCSSPSILTSLDDGDGCIRQIIDVDVLRERGTADIIIARRWSPDHNPQFTPRPVWSHVLRARHPGRHMVLDAYMHKSMLTASPPEVGAYVWHPSLADDPRSQWQDRLPVACSVQVLPPAPSPAHAEAWSRQAELTDRLFDILGWDRREFAGFRCDQRAPLWSAAYYMTFDLQPTESRASTKP